MFQNDSTATGNLRRIKSCLCTSDIISPFSEKPSYEDDLQKDGILKVNISPRIHATDLFSLFTADIIKEEVIFIR